MFSWQMEWGIIRAAVPEWEAFLFSREIYWPLNFDRDFEAGSGGKPRLSAGRLLLAILLLDYFALNDPQVETAVRNDLRMINELKADWKSNWQKKQELEIPARLRQWEQNIREIRGGLFSIAEYANQVNVRLILDLLLGNTDSSLSAHSQTHLAALDTQLKQYSSSGPFVWEAALAPAFDSLTHWYLFRKI